MPSYDLKCQCGNEFNVSAKMSDRENKSIQCPVCGSNELNAVFKSIGIIQSRKTPERPACPKAQMCGGCSH